MLKSPPSDLKLVNGCWHLKSEGINAAEEHVKRRITKDAVHFDIDAIVDPDSDLQHTLPSLDVFKSHMMRLGIQRTHRIVCYDAH